jgi:hypothetical protein
MFITIKLIVKLIFLKKNSFSSFKKLSNILLLDLITSMPSNIENINIRVEGKIMRFAKSMYDIKSCAY